MPSAVVRGPDRALHASRRDGYGEVEERGIFVEPAVRKRREREAEAVREKGGRADEPDGIDPGRMLQSRPTGVAGPAAQALTKDVARGARSPSDDERRERERRLVLTGLSSRALTVAAGLLGPH
jgi:hypothetical protein